VNFLIAAIKNKMKEFELPEIMTQQAGVLD
jgi:hypothetical protein